MLREGSSQSCSEQLLTFHTYICFPDLDLASALRPTGSRSRLHSASLLAQVQDLKDRLLERPRTANTGAVIGSASTESDVLAFIDVLVQVRTGGGEVRKCGQTATCWPSVQVRD